MIKKMLRIFLTAHVLVIAHSAYAADLIDVFQQSLVCDTIYQQAIAQRLVTKTGVPINVAALLPQIAFSANPSATRSSFSGTFLARFANTTIAPRNTTTLAYDMTLSASQTIFNFSQFAQVRGALAASKGADATLNSALQDLMLRTANAYFAVLRDEDNLRYSRATKLAFREQLSQIKEQYKVGLKTLTDVYTARASYDSAVANVISSETKLANDRENLRVITGVYYPKLAKLSKRFPLVRPLPMDIEKWVQVALAQNWNIKASRWEVEIARQTIKQQIAGHLPTVSVFGKYDRMYSRNVNSYNSLNERQGPGTETDRQVALNVNFPIFSGGGVIAQTNQAVYQYQIAQQQFEKTVRDTLNLTRQSYLGVIAGISKIKADQLTIESTIRSLQGLEESYRVGTETLVDVLNQQQKVFQAQTQYAQDRYQFVIDFLTLKQAAGTLSFEDLCSINAWLSENTMSKVRKKTKHTLKHKLKSK